MTHPAPDTLPQGAPGAADLPDLDLAALCDSVPGLKIGPRDHIRLMALLCHLIDQGHPVLSRGALGPVVAPLLAMNARQQEAIHAFYADAPQQSATDPLSDVTPIHTDRDGAPVRRLRVWLGALVVGACLFGLYSLLGTDVTVVRDQTPEVVQEVDRAATAGWLTRWTAWIASGVTGEGALRLTMMAFPLSLMGWLLYRQANQRARIDPEAGDTDASADEVGVPPIIRTGLLSGPGMTGAMGRLRLRRDVPTEILDAARTVAAAARRGGRTTRLYTRTDSRAVGHLVLIDRRSVEDQLADLGDLLTARLAQAGVPVQAYDLLADPTRLKPQKALLGRHGQVLSAHGLADQHHGDAVLVVAEATLALDARSGRLAEWLATFGPPAMLSVMTPRPRRSWGGAERQLMACGVSVFPMGPEGVKEYVTYRTATLSEAPTGSPPALPAAAAWTISDAIDAVQAADQGAGDEDQAVFVLQAALSPRAFSLLSAVAIFPVLIPELTLRMRAVLPGGAGQDSDILAELAALPWFRGGTLPFWLRWRLVRYAAPELLEAARDVIGSFQAGTGDARTAERTLLLARPQNRLTEFLGSFGAGTAQRILHDALFVRVMDRSEIGDMSVEATGEMTRALSRAARFQRARIIAAGVLGAGLAWLAAPALLAFGQGLLETLGDGIFNFFDATPINAEVGGLAVRFGLIATLFFLLTSAPRVEVRTSRGMLLRTFEPLRLARVLSVALGVITLAFVTVANIDIGHWLFTDVFLLVMAFRRRRSIPFDPVTFATERGVGVLIGGVLSVIAANAVLAVGLHLSFRHDIALALPLAVLSGLLFTGLAALFLSGPRPTFRNQIAAIFGLFPGLVTLSSILMVGYSLSAFLGVFLMLPAYDPAENPPLFGLRVLWLFPLLLVACHARLCSTFRAWLALVVITAVASGLAIGDVTQSAALTVLLQLVSTLLIVLSPLILFQYNLRVRVIRQSAYVAGVLVMAGILTHGTFEPGAANAQALPPEIVQGDNSVEDSGVPQNCLVDRSGREICDDLKSLTDGLTPIVVEAGSYLPTALNSAFVFADLYALAFVLIIWLWLRRNALAARGAEVWPLGSPRALAFVPVLVLPMLGFSFGDYTAQPIWIFPVLAALITYRYRWWGAVAVLLVATPMIAQTGIAAGTLLGGLRLDVYLCVLALIWLICTRNGLLRLMSIDRITPGQYATLFVLGLPSVGLAIPEIAAALTLQAGMLSTLILFLIGLSRVPLLPVALFVFATLIAQEFLSNAFPFEFVMEHLLFGIPGGLGIYDFFNMLLLAATGRALRHATLNDLGNTPTAYDGRLMGGLTTVAGNFWFRIVIILWALTSIDFSLNGVLGGISLTTISAPGVLGMACAFTLAFDMVSPKVREPAELTRWRDFFPLGAVVWLVPLAALCMAIFIAFSAGGTLFVFPISNISFQTESFNLLWPVTLLSYFFFGAATARATRGLRGLMLSDLDNGPNPLWSPIPSRLETKASYV